MCSTRVTKGVWLSSSGLICPFSVLFRGQRRLGGRAVALKWLPGPLLGVLSRTKAPRKPSLPYDKEHFGILYAGEDLSSAQNSAHRGGANVKRPKSLYQ